MKVLIVTEVFYPENFLINDFAVALVAQGYDVEVMTRQPSYPDGVVYDGFTNDEYSIAAWNGIKIHRFNTIEGYKHSKFKKIWNYIHYVRAGKRVIKKIVKGVDVILVHQTGPLTLALPAVYARRKWSIPVVIWTFDIWPDAVYAYGFPSIPPLTTLVNYIVEKVYRNVDNILVSSKQFIGVISQYCTNKNITYAPNWLLPTPDEESKVKLDTNNINFTFTGNISISQNLDNVIKGFAAAQIPNAVLNIIGDGSTLQSHKSLVESLGCSNVVFYGRLPYSQMQDILRQSDYLVLPLISKAGIDKTEPFKIQSYLKSGRPIYGIIKGAGREIIEEHHIGLCASPDDISDIANGFKRMTMIGDEEKELIYANSISLMNNRFSRDIIIKNVVDVLITSVNKD